MVESEIQVRFWKALIKDMDEGDRSREIHTTDLVYDCLRRAWYGKVIGDTISDSQGLLAVWIGKKLHEMPVCDRHEVSVIYEKDGVRVVGRVDEICSVGSDIIVLDKKTTRQIPGKPHEHHIKQVLFYAYMLWRTEGLRASKVAVMYIDVSNLDVKVYVVPVNQVMLEQAGRELEEKARILAEHLRNNTIPQRQMGWWCSYCSMFRRCMSD